MNESYDHRSSASWDTCVFLMKVKGLWAQPYDKSEHKVAKMHTKVLSQASLDFINESDRNKSKGSLYIKEVSFTVHSREPIWLDWCFCMDKSTNKKNELFIHRLVK